MECPECSRKIPEDARYCAYCAAPVAGCSEERKNPTAGPSVSGHPSPSGGEPAGQSLGETPTLKEAPGPDRDLSLGEEATMVSGPGEGIVEEKEIGSRYRVEGVLGRGGMGVVYRCRDGKLDREVAVKRLLAKEKASRAGLERFLREARTIAGLNHRNIVQVFDIGEDSGGSYIVMEYIRGGTLKNRMRESGKLDRTEVLKLARQIGQGLAYAHRKGVIHRDIKPANIFIDEEGVCKVGDFGLARFGTESELSMTGYGMGTLDYMPPEQRRDAKHADHRADIYSFGATLYELVTGKSPRTVRESELPGELKVTVLKAMEERPEDRYFSVMELLEDLEKGGGKKPVPLTVGTTDKGKCPSCGHNNELSSKYCESCGAGLFGKCPKCSEEIRLGLKHCPKCGVEVEKREKFNSHIERGDRYVGEGKISRAIKEYQAGLELEPEDEGGRKKLLSARKTEILSPLARDLCELVQVKAGKFIMGSDVAGADERPAHEVRINHDFLIGKYPVTQRLYHKVMGVNPSRFEGDDHPVEKISWYDAIKFCRKATEMLKKDDKLPEGWEVRLPTEAEWEYACRAGTETPYYWGSEFDGDYCWYYGNTRRGGIFSGWSTRPVGQKKPNAWGIYDIIGNVWEWCRDWYDGGYYARSPDQDPTGPASGSSRVMRGGSLSTNSRYLRSTYRDRNIPGLTSSTIGFRVILAGR